VLQNQKKERSKQEATVVGCDGNGVVFGEQDIKEGPDIPKLSKISSSERV
jgi:hypothetical protein